MYAGFADRAAKVQALIREPTTSLVLVTGAEPQRVEQTRQFASELKRLGLRPGALIVNRVIRSLPAVEDIRRAKLPLALKRKLERNVADFGALKAREAAWLESLRQLSDGAPILTATDLGEEPGNLNDLLRIAQSLFAGSCNSAGAQIM